MEDPQVLIVGGGLAGLCCARELWNAGIPNLILEAGENVGGRVRTDELDGFLLDRGFQVLLTAYPEARRVLDYDALHLARFEPGALVRLEGAFHRFVDPWRRPRHLLATALSPVASLPDKLRVARVRREVCRGSLDELYERPETTTMEALKERGFSERIIARFFQPFLGGVFLDRKLTTSSRMWEFVFRMFAQGDAALPAAGMEAIPRQLAESLPPESLRTSTPVAAVRGTSVVLETGEELRGDAVVIACDAPAAARLQGEPFTAEGREVTCLYYAAEKPPVDDAILVLNGDGDGDGPINNLCVPSQVATGYAPAGRSLISVSVVGTTSASGSVEDEVRSQLRDWFGSVAADWEHLRSYHIPYALPDQSPPALSPVAKPVRRSDGLYICGDYLDTASIQGAMVSGRRAAESIASSRAGASAP